ncbi:hypothetical protein [Tychonema sp. BBK16]|uniref:hypothetical protein n=1 Tax=Tychonema sp. BBK16 TaxID=2699888 RepID=UPI001F1C307A|nr:hypothetical protein [Tychonema sp. BBK16]MCF6374516.1 hypothetical protein [Tychonema sp. BBK16]
MKSATLPSFWEKYRIVKFIADGKITILGTVYGGGSRSNSSTPATVNGDRRIISRCEFGAVNEVS